MVALSGTLLANVIRWDVRNWGEALGWWAEHARARFDNCLALEIGGRSGGLSLWLALQGARVVCSDLEEPTPLARDLHEAYGVRQRVTYASLDATALPFTEAFDLIVFKSVLGVIGNRNRPERQRIAIEEMHRALKPGGELLFAENLTGSPIHTVGRRIGSRWGRTWRYVTLNEMAQYLSPFESVRTRTTGFTGAFGRTERQRRVLGALDQALLDALVPARWRYILFGVARKASSPARA
jgi:SAM-dependent methyltransferase